MLIAYAVGRFIIVALDRKAGKLTLSLRDRQDNLIATYRFNDTDFEKLEIDTSESIILMEIDIDGQKSIRKIYLSSKN